MQEEMLALWLLLEELGVFEQLVREDKTVRACKKLSESFSASGELDAEYYQPKYDVLFSRLRDFPTLDIITSGAILHLSVTSESVLADYLTLVLNSCIVGL